MIYTLETGLTEEEKTRKANIHSILTGNGNPEKYKADTAHVFEAGKYRGCFITTNQCILRNAEELGQISRAQILKPSNWLQVFDETDPENGQILSWLLSIILATYQL